MENMADCIGLGAIHLDCMAHMTDHDKGIDSRYCVTLKDHFDMVFQFNMSVELWNMFQIAHGFGE